MRNDLAAAPYKARCSRSSNFLSAFQAPSFNLPSSGLRKKLLPFSVKEPRFPPHGILPVRRMKRHFPDVVAPRSRAPGGFFCGHSLEGLFEIRSAPGLFLVGFIKQREHELSGNHRWLPRGSSLREILERMALSLSGVNALVFCFEEFAPCDSPLSCTGTVGGPPSR